MVFLVKNGEKRRKSGVVEPFFAFFSGFFPEGQNRPFWPPPLGPFFPLFGGFWLFLGILDIEYRLNGLN